jgi:hypothetical protein
MATQWGYGQDFVVIETDSPPGKLAIKIQTFDEMVRDYIANRREGFLTRGLVQGAVFDDDMGSGL